MTLKKILYVVCAIAATSGAARTHLPTSFGKQDKAAAGAMLQGKVVYVDDGDTVILLTHEMQQTKIRLASIDAPESSHTNKQRGRVGQPYANNAQHFLADLVKGQEVSAKCFEQDRYGRSVCEIFKDGRSVNAQLVSSGWAWANQASKGRYLRDKSLVDLERQARAARVGLWAGANPVAPWEWRKTCWEGGDCRQ